MSPSSRSLVVFLVALAGVASPRGARANGAFPGSLRVFAPAAQPDAILLATNFGLISTSDGGRRWDWVCEHGDALFASTYELGAGASPRLYAAGPIGFAISTDSACSWVSAPQLEAATVNGIFADPVDDRRVWVAARTRDAGPGEGPALYLSTDGGLSFEAPRYRVPLGATIDSVESARTRPQRLYLTASHGGQPGRVELVRSDDGGNTFVVFDHTAATRGDQLRIAAVDPQDPDRIYLRVQGFPDERLVISSDGGASLTDAFLVERGRLAAFVRRTDGTLVVAALSDTAGGSIHASIDGGRSFQLRSTAIRAGALSERDGVLLASTDNFQDGFALARSEDAATWTPMFRYADVAGTRSCPGRTRIAETCAAACIQEVVRGIFPPETCPSQPPRPEPSPDAAQPSLTPAPNDGCACHLTGPPRHPPLVLIIAALSLTLAALLRRRRYSPRPARPSRASSAACSRRFQG